MNTKLVICRVLVVLMGLEEEDNGFIMGFDHFSLSLMGENGE